MLAFNSETLNSYDRASGSTMMYCSPSLSHTPTHTHTHTHTLSLSLIISLSLFFRHKRVGNLFHPVGRADHHHGSATTYNKPQSTRISRQLQRIIRILCKRKTVSERARTHIHTYIHTFIHSLFILIYKYIYNLASYFSFPPYHEEIRYSYPTPSSPKGRNL